MPILHLWPRDCVSTRLARQEREKKLQGHKTLAEQLAEKREREEEELRERNRHKPTVPLDEVDVEFLAAKVRYWKTFLCPQTEPIPQANFNSDTFTRCLLGAG